MTTLPPIACAQCGQVFIPARRDQVRHGRGGCAAAGTAQQAAAQNGQGSLCSPSSPGSLPRPHLEEAALHGLPGEVVAAIAPHTEADPAALLLSYLAYLGNACGPQPSVQIGASQHPGRLFVLLVGDSATGRKGTAGAEVERLFELAAPEWQADRIERRIQ